jgi:hypothetical protein
VSLLAGSAAGPLFPNERIVQVHRGERVEEMKVKVN